VELKTYLEPNEIESLINAAPTLRDKLIIRLLYRLSCRVTELINIKVDEIDWARGLVLIQHLKTGIKKECPKCHAKIGRKSNFCPKCGENTSMVQASLGEEVRKRFISIDKETLIMAKEYVEKRKANSDRLIPLTRQMITHIVQEVAKAAGLGGKILLNPETGRMKGISPHRFRDAAALRWLEKRGDVEGQKALQEHLGHKSYATTARYLKLSPSQVQKIHREVFDE
jgi:integrase/recombinase XerD